MPYLTIQASGDLTKDARQNVIRQASALVAKSLGKPEKYVMVRLDPAQPMMFAGTDAPCAYLELKSIGLPESATAMLSKVLCRFISDELKIPAERIYIEFTDVRDTMWGWNGSTF